MGAEQCLLALEAGRESVRRAEQAGSQLFIGGEMGIGNTTRRRPWPARCWMRRRARWSGRELG